MICAFYLQVAGQPFSVALAGVEFREDSGVTILTYTEQAYFLDTGDYDATSRLQGTNGLLDTFTAHVSQLA